jgi:hypothetical protein
MSHQELIDRCLRLDSYAVYKLESLIFVVWATVYEGRSEFMIDSNFTQLSD